jgi:hypothetical protein
MSEPGNALALGQPPPQDGESGEPSLMLANGKRRVINQMHFNSWNCHLSVATTYLTHVCTYEHVVVCCIQRDGSLWP